jgi:hypothetical protein
MPYSALCGKPRAFKQGEGIGSSRLNLFTGDIVDINLYLPQALEYNNNRVLIARNINPSAISPLDGYLLKLRIYRISGSALDVEF